MDNGITSEIIGSAISVHKELGPGLLESTYEACLVHDLKSKGFNLERQKSLPISYKGITLDCGYRIDLLVENKVILELKSVDYITAIHEAQLLSYLRMSKLNLGLLINFNVAKLKDGIKRISL